MKTLAIDTSTSFLSLACLDDERTVSMLHEDAGTKHSEIITAKIKKLAKDAGWTMKDIDLIAFGLGPGSFTGLRIGAATVKGMAMALGCGVAGVPTLDAVAMRVPSGDGSVAPIIDAHKGKVYSCFYERTSEGYLRRKTDYLLSDVRDLERFVTGKTVFFANGLDKYRNVIEKWAKAEIAEGVDWFPRADDIGRMALSLVSAQALPPQDLEPMYLYAKECNVLGHNL